MRRRPDVLIRCAPCVSASAVFDNNIHSRDKLEHLESDPRAYRGSASMMSFCFTCRRAVRVRLRHLVAERLSSRQKMPIQHNAATATIGRPRVEAKFLYLGSEKFYVKGATYGAFAPNSNGDQFPESLSRAKDFALMREAGINAILTYTVPPVAMLDQASEHGIRVIVNIPWMAYECFLEEARFRRRVIR